MRADTYRDGFRTLAGVTHPDARQATNCRGVPEGSGHAARRADAQSNAAEDHERATRMRADLSRTSGVAGLTCRTPRLMGAGRLFGEN